MKNNKFRIIVEITISILIVIGLVIIGFNVIRPSGIDEEATKNLINNLNDKLLNGASAEEIKQLTGIPEINPLSLLTGPDSFVALKPSEEVELANNLTEYVTLQTQLVKNVEEKIRTNFTYTVEEETDNTENYVVYKVALKSYYQIAYLLDLQELQKQLLALDQSPESLEIKEYKAKVVAMKILDEKLDEYVNDDEYSIANVYEYKNDKEKTIASLSAYLSILQGLNYHDKIIMEQYEQNRVERIASYITSAKQNNIIKENVLDL